jgi:Tfp pilus assembly protein FimT
MFKKITCPFIFQCEVSLVEVIVVITIIMILSVLAIPSYSQYLANRNLENAAREIVGDIVELKHRALAEDMKYGIKFNTDTNNYEIWRCSNSDSSCNGYTDMVTAKSPAAFRHDIKLDDVAFGGEGTAVTFQTRGTANPGHIILKNGLGSTATITVNITGRTYVDWVLK